MPLPFRSLKSLDLPTSMLSRKKRPFKQLNRTYKASYRYTNGFDDFCMPSKATGNLKINIKNLLQYHLRIEKIGILFFLFSYIITCISLFNLSTLKTKSSAIIGTISLSVFPILAHPPPINGIYILSP